VVIATVKFYAINPAGMFATAVGGTAVYEGPGAATGTAVIDDPEIGSQGNTLDDDSNGGETATADVTVGGNTSTGSNVDAELVWTLRDTVTGQQFQVVQFDVENGAAAGDYTLSEFPLVPGRTYETLEYETNPDVLSGDIVFTYADFEEFPNDGVVSGTAGNDVIAGQNRGQSSLG